MGYSVQHDNIEANRSNREVLLGFTGKDYTVIAASKAAMRGATILKASDDKTKQLNKHTLMAFSGEAGDTGMMVLYLHWDVTTLMYTCSTICRVYPSKHPAVLDAKRHRSKAFSGCKLRPRRASEKLEVKAPLHRQSAIGRNGSDHKATTSLLARLPSVAGTSSICCSWLCSVRHIHPLQSFEGLEIICAGLR